MPPKLSDAEILTAVTYTLADIATAAARQLDPDRFVADLRLLAEYHARNGHGPAAGLLDELIKGRLLGKGIGH